MRERIWQLAMGLLGWCFGTVLPLVAQRLTLKTVVLLAILAVLTHLCGRVLRLLFPQPPCPLAPAPPGPRISAGHQRPTAAERRLLAWLSRTRPPDTGPPRPGRRHRSAAPSRVPEQPP